MNRIARVFCLLLLTAPLSLGVYGDTDSESSAAAEEKVPFDEIRTFTQVFAKIKNDYVEDVSDKELLENAIRGMLAGLDPHSAYLDAEAYRDLQEGTSGEFGGLGIEVGMDEGFVKVIAPIDDTPAARAGIQAGDLIIRLDETPVKGLSLNEAVNLMRGKPGTEIVLTVVRENVEKPLRIAIVRDVIRVQSVKSRLLEPGFGYLRVSHFQSHTGDDLRQELTALKQEAGGSLKGLVLDLRNNPGGVLGSAVAVSDAFLTGGLIVYTEGRVKDSELEFTAKPDDLLDGAPIVVLVNGGSASASEIVAGALQDRKRAVIMGNRTFGKGSVQTILPVDGEAALKLTTARYYTPSGRSIQAEGIVPDIVIDRVRVEKLESADVELVKEAHLARHLGGAEAEEAAPAEDQETPAQSTDESLLTSDYALHEALVLLKGLVLLQARNDTD